MKKNANAKKQNKIKIFFRRFVEKIDKKMEEKAKSSRSCCNTNKRGDNSCCG